MKINNFLAVGVSTLASTLPSIANAMTAAHMATVGLGSKTSMASQAVQNVATPENMNAIHSFIYHNPGITITSLGSFVAIGMMAAVYLSFKEDPVQTIKPISPNQEPNWFNKLKSDMGDKIDSLISKHNVNSISHNNDSKNKI